MKSQKLKVHHSEVIQCLAFGPATPLFLLVYLFFVDMGFMCVLLIIINDGLSQFGLHCQLRQSQ